MEATYEKGAACVVGIVGTINDDDIDAWLYKFLEGINHTNRDKRTIESAVAYANRELSLQGAEFYAVVYGDGSQVLNFN